MIHFGAPWGKLLWVFTILGTCVLGGAAISIFVASPSGTRLLLACGMVATLIVCALLAVRGYALDGDTLLIERPAWTTRVSLRGLRAVRHDKSLLNGALRVGNGGLFVFAGWFWSARLGWFRVTGNDILGRPVLLELPDTQWVVTPDDPRAFVEAAERLIATDP